MSDIKTKEPDFDDHIDGEILECLNPDKPVSFILYAGAGTGKTRSLKFVLEEFRKKYGEHFRLMGKKIAVITYTNAAADEIIERVGEDNLFPISTIHSFCWRLIQNYQKDIQKWMINKWEKEAIKINEKLKKKDNRSKAGLDPYDRLSLIEERLERLKKPQHFTYSPDGDNFGESCLTHADVLKITADFIANNATAEENRFGKETFKNVLIDKYPFLLIDESQDTQKELLEGLIGIANEPHDRFALGLFGDEMQRIYPGGCETLDGLFVHKKELSKQLNHRSPKRIIALGNAIRNDGKIQFARKDSEQGFARLFTISNTISNKDAFEQNVRHQMAEITKDAEWENRDAVKILILEHRMAASRYGFSQMYEAFDKVSNLKSAVMKEEPEGIRFFSRLIAPVFLANRENKKFELLAHLRAKSPLFKKCVSDAKENDEKYPLSRLNSSVQQLLEVIKENPEASFLDILHCVANNDLFKLPVELMPFCSSDGKNGETVSQTAADDGTTEQSKEDETSPDLILEAWRKFLETPYKQIYNYMDYLHEESPFSTQQGIKGLEFDRVLVILDDKEARGYAFSYEELFNDQPTPALSGKSHEKDTSKRLARTRRLFYVTCTRAKKSLAVVAYSKNPAKTGEMAIKKGWFSEGEIVCADKDFQ